MGLAEGNGNDMVMPVTPMGGYGGGSGMGWGGSDGWWIILLFLFAFGNGGWGGYGNGGGSMGAEVQRGFDQSAVMSGVSGIQSGISGLSTQLCNGFAGVSAGFANAETAATARQMANMNQAFAAQTAVTQGINQLASQFADCCCENRLASANLQNVVQTEACADRTAFNEGVRDILQNQNAGIQRILDTMCQDKIDAKNERIADLERQLTMANLAASQGAQTAAILANNEAQTAALEQYLAPVPRPAYVVPNPNCCGQNYGTCGCGCGIG